jgi:hypothetical protein
MTSGEPKHGREERERRTWSSFLVGLASFFRSGGAPTPSSKAVFVERGASVIALGWGFFKFSMGATDWVESNELLVETGEDIFGGPLTDIRAVRERSWYMRKTPVVEIVFASQRLQLAVADPGSLISLLQARGIATERTTKAKPRK